MTYRRLALACASACAGAIAVMAPAQGADDVPIAGQTIAAGGSSTNATGLVITVHSVRRIEGGTAVYYSVGFPSSVSFDVDPTSISGSLSVDVGHYLPKKITQKSGEVGLSISCWRCIRSRTR